MISYLMMQKNITNNFLLSPIFLKMTKIQQLILAYFSLSNDLLLYADIANKSKWKKYAKKIGLNFQKRNRKSYPAVKLGRLATNQDYQSKGYGKKIVDWIKYSFTNDKKAGCLFITVDAYNNPGAVRFYECNGFNFMKEDSIKDKTRLMFCSLLEKVV